LELFIVDDYQLIRDLLVRALSREKSVSICGVSDGRDSPLILVKKQRPDLVLVNLALRPLSALDFIKQLSRWCHHIPVLTYAMNEHELFHAERALIAGAVGHVGKDQSLAVLLEAISETGRGRVYFDDQLQKRLLLHARDPGAVPAEDPLAGLSDREAQVFYFIGHGISTREMAETLNLSVKTIETYRERIREKLKMASSSALLQYAIKEVHPVGRPTWGTLKNVAVYDEG
jgi:DNA-binding NarL/FixJ family response regulator